MSEDQVRELTVILAHIRSMLRDIYVDEGSRTADLITSILWLIDDATVIVQDARKVMEIDDGGDA